MEYKKRVGIDLHIHSTASDGMLTPSEILSLAQELHLGAFAITDHDTIEGSKEIIEAGIPSSVNFLTGVEISTGLPLSFAFSGSLHILGYGIDIYNIDLNHALAKQRKARKDRNPGIIANLNDLGFDLTLEEVIRETGNMQTGRPQIAQMMLAKGFVKTIDEAFDKYLAKGRPGYIDKYRIDCAGAIKIILDAGGLPVLAHPSFVNKTGIEDLVIALVNMGLKGIEAYYPGHSISQTRKYTELAGHYDLIVTGGTDFHGSLKPDIQMGSGKGNLFIPYDLYEKILDFL